MAKKKLEENVPPDTLIVMFVAVDGTGSGATYSTPLPALFIINGSIIFGVNEGVTIPPDKAHHSEVFFDGDRLTVWQDHINYSPRP